MFKLSVFAAMLLWTRRITILEQMSMEGKQNKEYVSDL